MVADRMDGRILAEREREKKREIRDSGNLNDRYCVACGLSF